MSNLYLVLHHRDDPEQPWANQWLDENRIANITTTPEVARLCDEAKRDGKRIFIHRCAFVGLPIICCSAIVTHIDQLGDDVMGVRFGFHVVSDEPPPGSGHNFYLE